MTQTPSSSRVDTENRVTKFNDTPLPFKEIVIVGAGVAGLFTALKLAPRPVTVITARALGRGGASPWAQGGIAAALGEDDSPDLHLEDTINAGAGLVDREAAKTLTKEGPARIEDLARYGAPFDRDENGAYKLGREAAHGRDRIIHATGDQAGAAIMAALIERASAADHIEILERIIVEDLIITDGTVTGLLVYDVAREERAIMPTANAILATGGAGGLYNVTTNPLRAQGHGLAFAARAGAIIRDAEFVQFHPTALNIGVDPAPLATEALRGVGAVLKDQDGRAFMADYHGDKDLAPRDIVARAVEAEIKAGRGAFLDATDAVGATFPERFPTVFAACREGGLDPRISPMPVAPAAHYHMGGVRTDLDGRASIRGLWAVGEVASSGVHGANRLASNSLLEAVVFGARAADALRGAAIDNPPGSQFIYAPKDRLDLPAKPAPQDAMAILRKAMADGCALLRSAQSLQQTLNTIDALKQRTDMTSGLKSALVTAELIVKGALAREESRGGHYRTDFPTTKQDARHGELCFSPPENDPGTAHPTPSYKKAPI